MQGMRVTVKCSAVRRETWRPDLIRALLPLCLKLWLRCCSEVGVTMAMMLCNGCVARSLAGSASGVVGVCEVESCCHFAGNFFILA